MRSVPTYAAELYGALHHFSGDHFSSAHTTLLYSSLSLAILQTPLQLFHLFTLLFLYSSPTFHHHHHHLLCCRHHRRYHHRHHHLLHRRPLDCVPSTSPSIHMSDYFEPWSMDLLGGDASSSSSFSYLFRSEQGGSSSFLDDLDCCPRRPVVTPFHRSDRLRPDAVEFVGCQHDGLDAGGDSADPLTWPNPPLSPSPYLHLVDEVDPGTRPSPTTSVPASIDDDDAELPAEVEDVDPSSSSSPVAEAYQRPAEVDVNPPEADNNGSTGPLSTTTSSTGPSLVTVATVKQEKVNPLTTHAALPTPTLKPYSSRSSSPSSSPTPSKKKRPTREQRRRRRSRRQADREVIDLTGDSDVEMPYAPSPVLVPYYSTPLPSPRTLDSTPASSDTSSPSSPSSSVLYPGSPFGAFATPSPSSSTSCSSSASSFSPPSSPVFSFTSSTGSQLLDPYGHSDIESLPPLEQVKVEPWSSSVLPFIDLPHRAAVVLPDPVPDPELFECRHGCRCWCSSFTPSGLRQTTADGNKKLLSESSRRKHERNLDLHPECQGRGVCAHIARNLRHAPVKRVKVE